MQLQDFTRFQAKEEYKIAGISSLSFGFPRTDKKAEKSSKQSKTNDKSKKYGNRK